MRTRLSVWTIAVLTLMGTGLGVAVRGQGQVFRSSVEVVEVDVQVLTRDGFPITDLRLDEFQLEVDGKPRTPIGADLIRYSAPPAAKPKDAPATPAANPTTASPAVASNKDAPGRLFILVLDVANIGRGNGKGAMEAAARFVQRLSPADKVAVATLPIGAGSEFTSDRERILAIVRRTVGSAIDIAPNSSQINMSLAEAFAGTTRSDRDMWNEATTTECVARSSDRRENCMETMFQEARMMVDAASQQTRQSLMAFEALLKRISRIHGQKFIVYVGEGMVTGTSMGSLDSLFDMRELGRRVHEARASIYVLQYGSQFLNAIDTSRSHASRTTLADTRLREEGLGELAGATGGTLFKLTNAADYAFDRIARETSASWVLRFTALDTERDGRRHNIRVRVTRPGVEVRARKQFVSNRAKANAPSPAPSLALLVSVMRSPQPVQNLPITLASYVVAEPSSGSPQTSDLRLIVAGEVACGEPSVTQADIMVGISDSKRRTIYTPVETVTDTVPSADGRSQCLYFTTRMPLPPDRYTVRLAAMDPSGRLGAVDQAIDARLAGEGPLQAGSLLVTDPSLRIDRRMRILVDGRVTSSSVAAYLDLVDAGSGAGDGTARNPDITFRLVSADDEGRALTQVPATVTADKDAAGRWYAEALIDMPARPGTQYVLQAVLSRDGQPVVVASRPVQTPAQSVYIRPKVIERPQ